MLLTTELASHLHYTTPDGSHIHSGTTGTDPGAAHSFTLTLASDLDAFAPGYPDPIPATEFQPPVDLDPFGMCAMGDGLYHYYGLANVYPGQKCGSDPIPRAHIQGVTAPNDVHSHSFTAPAAGLHTHPISLEGGNAPHNNVQPTTTVGGYIIKT
jgi:hypothetical protein